MDFILETAQKSGKKGEMAFEISNFKRKLEKRFGKGALSWRKTGGSVEEVQTFRFTTSSLRR